MSDFRFNVATTLAVLCFAAAHIVQDQTVVYVFLVVVGAGWFAYTGYGTFLSIKRVLSRQRERRP